MAITLIIMGIMTVIVIIREDEEADE